MTCTSRTVCDKNPEICICVDGRAPPKVTNMVFLSGEANPLKMTSDDHRFLVERHHKTCEELGVCNQVNGCKGCKAQAAPVIYLQTGIEPGDALPLAPEAPLTTLQYVTRIVAIVLLGWLAGALVRLLGTYQEPITQALATAHQAATAYTDAAVRALWHMSNLLG